MPHDANKVVWRVVQRLCALAGVQSTRAESLQVIRYAVGQKYNAHFDAYDKSTVRGQRTTADGGNRMLTMLVYLRTAQQGGATEFPDSGMPQGGPLMVEPRYDVASDRCLVALLLIDSQFGRFGQGWSSCAVPQL